jgi:glucokinase
MRSRALAVDLGGTNLRTAVVHADGRVEHRRSAATLAREGPSIVVDQIAGEIFAVAEVAGLDETCPVGIALPGPVDPTAGVVAFMPNLSGWERFPIGEALHASLGRRFVLGNDGNCGAVGEARFGAVGARRDLVYLALGTGVGGGIVSDGRLLVGARGLGGEVGHVVVALDGPRCTCGGVGCLEAFVGGWALMRDAALVAGTADGDRLRFLAEGAAITPTILARAAAEGDPAANAILERAGRALGAAIGAFVNVFNPDVVVIGGGVGLLDDPLLSPAKRAIASHSFALARDGLRIELTSLGADTALLGAGALALGQAG